MARRGLLQVIPRLDGLPQPITGGIALPSSGAAQAASQKAASYASIANQFNDVGEEIGRWADKAAVKEGAEDGQRAGMDPEFRPRGDGTLYSEAFDRTGLQTFGAKVRLEIGADIEAGGNLAAKKKAWLSKVPEQLHADVDHIFTRAEITQSRNDARAEAARIDTEAVDTATSEVRGLVTGMRTRAYDLGLDPKAGELLAKDMTMLEEALKRTRPNGARVITPKQADKILQQTQKEIEEARTLGAFSRLPGLKSRRAFIDEIGGVPEGDGSFTGDTGGEGGAPSVGADGRESEILGASDVQGARSATAPGLLADDIDVLDDIASDPKGRSVTSGDPLVSRLTAEERAVRVRDGFIAKKLGNQVKGVIKSLMKGYDVKAEEIDALHTALDYGGEKTQKLKAKLDIAQQMMTFQQSSRKARPAEIDAFVRSERNRMREEGADTMSAAKVEVAEALLREQRAWLNRDPAGWADRVGLIPATELDLSTPERAKETLETRIIEAETVAKYYGQETQYIRPHQKDQLTAALAEGGDKALQLAGTIVEAAGPDAERIFKELSKDAPVVAKIGGMVSAQGFSALARDAMDGLALKRSSEFKALAPSADEARRAASGVISGALRGSPQDESAMVEVANAIYEIRARRQGKTGFDAPLWQKGLREVLGENEVNGTKYGGVVGQRAPILIPPYVRHDTWKDMVEMIGPGDLDRAGLDRPVASDGSVMPMTRVSAGTLVQVGDGLFAVATGDPSTPGQERFISRVVPGETRPRPGRDGLFLIDMKKLSPVLAERRPDYFNADMLPEKPQTPAMMRLGGPKPDTARMMFGADLKQNIVFGGEQAAGTDKGVLTTAKSMLDAGDGPRDVWAKTGWFKGRDGNWRFEIDDSKSVSKAPVKQIVSGNVEKETYRLDELLDHPELYKAYPELKSVPVKMVNLNGPDGIASGKEIGIDPRRLKTENVVRTLLLHEAQHVVQYIEGTDLGMVKRLFTDYGKRSEEIEAYDVMNRADIHPTQRRDFPPALLKKVKNNTQ
jgi:hypothetical protein